MILEDRARNAEGFPLNGDCENKNTKKGGGILRPRFLCAADYAFYLRRHLSCERRRNDPAVGAPGDEALSAGIPRLSFLLRRLEEDIHTAYLSFLEDFASDLHDGLGILLSLLRTCGERQKGAGLFTYATCGRARNYVIHRGAINEFYCLLCLKACTKSSLAVSKMSEHKTGLASIASCITSTHIRSRIVALELLTAACRGGGHPRVVEAMSAVRVLFGESVRFKSLVSVLNSNLHGSAGFETTALVFLNTLLDQCPNLSDRIRIQSELEEAGLDIDLLEKQLRGKFGEGHSSHRVWAEIDKWRELRVELQDALLKHQENIQLRREVELLKEALKRLRDERKGILSIHSQLKGQWNSMEQRLQDLTLKSRVPATSSSVSTSSSSEDVRPPPQHESELDEVLIDIPTIPAGSILDVAHKRQPLVPPPLPPNHPRLSDSGVGSSHSPPDSEPDSWHNGPDPQRAGRVRFSDAGTRRRVEVLHSESFSGAVVLPPGESRVRCADIAGVPPPLPARPKKRRSHSAGRSLLPRSLQRLSRRNSRSDCDLSGEEKQRRPASRMGSSLDGMIHREIAKAIRDRHALFGP